MSLIDRDIDRGGPGWARRRAGLTLSRSF